MSLRCRGTLEFIVQLDFGFPHVSKHCWEKKGYVRTKTAVLSFLTVEQFIKSNQIKFIWYFSCLKHNTKCLTEAKNNNDKTNKKNLQPSHPHKYPETHKHTSSDPLHLLDRDMTLGGRPHWIADPGSWTCQYKLQVVVLSMILVKPKSARVCRVFKKSYMLRPRVELDLNPGSGS